MGDPLSPAVIAAVARAARDGRPNPLHVDGLTALRYSGPGEHVVLDIWSPGSPAPAPFQSIGGRIRTAVLQLPHRARLEYRIAVDGHSILDPLNPRTAANPFGENSVAVGPGYRPPTWTHVRARAGSLVEIRVRSTVLGGRRSHRLYSPAGSLPRTPLPLLVVHDGSDYRRFADLTRAVDVLVGNGAIQPIRMVLLDPRHRDREYVATEDHAVHVVEEVLPHVASRARSVEPLGIMGASLGAVAGWHAAWRFPGTFTRLFLQSGTYAFNEPTFLAPTMFTSIHRFVTCAGDDPRLAGARVFATCGRYETLLDWNRRAASILTDAGIDHRYRESWAGHDWGAWGDWFQPALHYLYPPIPNSSRSDPSAPDPRS